MKAQRKQLPEDFMILNERPAKMDFKTFRDLRKRMNKVLRWYTHPRGIDRNFIRSRVTQLRTI